eukprot:3940876-Rhodomonas_salina.7
MMHLPDPLSAPHTVLPGPRSAPHTVSCHSLAQYCTPCPYPRSVLSHTRAQSHRALPHPRSVPKHSVLSAACCMDLVSPSLSPSSKYTWPHTRCQYRTSHRAGVGRYQTV